MVERARVLAVIAVVLVVGIMIGSAISQRGRASQGEAAANTPRPGAATEWPEGRVRVDVLNAGGTKGVAQGATEILRDAGLDVVNWGNDARFSDSVSRVVDRVGDTTLARRVAEVLGIELVLSDPDATRLVEVTVKLGPEWTASTPSDGGGGR